MQHAYRLWKEAQDSLERFDNVHSDDYDMLHQQAARALLRFVSVSPHTPQEAALAISAALYHVDLPETERLIVMDALAFLNRGAPASKIF